MKRFAAFGALELIFACRLLRHRHFTSVPGSLHGFCQKFVKESTGNPTGEFWLCSLSSKFRKKTTRTSSNSAVRRIWMRRTLSLTAAAFAALVCRQPVYASGPVSVYALISKVSFEPNAENPQRIRILAV